LRDARSQAARMNKSLSSGYASLFLDRLFSTRRTCILSTRGTKSSQGTDTRNCDEYTNSNSFEFTAVTRSMCSDSSVSSRSNANCQCFTLCPLPGFDSPFSLKTSARVLLFWICTIRFASAVALCASCLCTSASSSRSRSISICDFRSATSARRASTSRLVMTSVNGSEQCLLYETYFCSVIDDFNSFR
jgi:hypothetical protein